MKRMLTTALLAAATAAAPALAQVPAAEPAQTVIVQPVAVPEEAPKGSSGPGSVLLGSAGGAALAFVLVAVVVVGAIAAVANSE